MSSESYKRGVNELFACVDRWRDGYRTCRLTVLAAHHDNQWKILNAQLAIRMGPVERPPKTFETESAFAGQFDLDGGFDTAVALLRDLEKGTVAVDGRQFVFQLGTSFGAYFELLHPVGLTSGRRLSTLRINGSRRSEFFEQTRVDWELKAAAIPMDGVWDMAAEVGLPLNQGDSCYFEVVAVNVVEFSNSSTIRGDECAIEIFMPENLDPEKVRLGFKIFDQRQLVRRASLLGNDLTWQLHAPMQHGSAKLTVPKAAVVQAFVSYNGGAQQQHWIVDPAALPNGRRAALALYDKDLELLRGFLFGTVQRRNGGRDFEEAVTALLYVLGFSAVNLGGIPRLGDTPDVLCCTPSGHYALVECTLGLPDHEDKLNKLFARSQALRATLDDCGLQHMRLLPVLVSAMTRKDVPQTEIDKATQMRIALIFREELEAVLQRSTFGENAEAIYAETAATVDGTAQLPLAP